MPPPGLDHQPEPTTLHAQLSTPSRPLNWGDPIPTKKEIAAEFGDRATTAGLAMLARVAAIEPLVTEDLMSAVAPGTEAYQLESRVKSPQSLARKLRDRGDYRRTARAPEDLLRYTVVAPEPDDVIKAAVATVERLRSRGWTTEAAHHSYVDGSRYKGLHVFLRCHGEQVELQIHSRESIDVKTRTTPLYAVERDRRQDTQTRDSARAACIALSDGMRHPAGIAQLTELGGVPVNVRSYGKKGGGPAARPAAAQPSTTVASEQPQKAANLHDREGMSR